jgi:tetratricopeptide (TPR) repeat protein
VHFRTLSFFVAVAIAFAGNAFAAGSKDVWEKLIKDGIDAAGANDLPKAEQLFVRATREADQFGHDDPRAGTTYNSLGLVYREEKKFAEAEKAFQKALEILQRVYGPDSLDVGNISFNLASVALDGGRYEPALPYIDKSLAIFKNRLGATSLKAASALCMRGDAYRNLNKFSDAEWALKQCADIRESAGGVENADLGDALYSLGLVYAREGKFALADPRLKMAEKIRELTLGVTSPAFADALEAHAGVLKSLGRDKDAAKDLALANAVRGNNKKTK